jgi:ABC-type uncharacterized transport system permease subunit
VVSSFCVGVVRMAVAVRVAMEAEDGWEAAVTTVTTGAGASAGAVGATLKRRFRASLYKRVASAFTYVTMW